MVSLPKSNFGINSQEVEEEFKSDFPKKSPEKGEKHAQGIQIIREMFPAIKEELIKTLFRNLGGVDEVYDWIEKQQDSNLLDVQGEDEDDYEEEVKEEYDYMHKGVHKREGKNIIDVVEYFQNF